MLFIFVDIFIRIFVVLECIYCGAMIVYVSKRFTKWLDVYNPKRYRALYEVELKGLKNTAIFGIKLPYNIAVAIIEAKFGKFRIINKSRVKGLNNE